MLLLSLIHITTQEMTHILQWDPVPAAFKRWVIYKPFNTNNNNERERATAIHRSSRSNIIVLTHNSVWKKNIKKQMAYEDTRNVFCCHKT